MNIEARLQLCQRLALLASYRPRNRKAKRRFKSQRRRIVAKLIKGRVH